ncbi:MAG: hypothetical protein ABEJ06_00065 [Haloarculaceae archaeon]
MPHWNEPRIVHLDARAALQAALDAVDGPLLAFVEFDVDEFNTLYLAEEAISMYPDEEAMIDHFERIHSYVHIDFNERQLFTDTIVPVATRVRYIATSTDALTMVRYYHGDDGLFFALTPDEDVDRVVKAVDAALEAPP